MDPGPHSNPPSVVLHQDDIELLGIPSSAPRGGPTRLPRRHALDAARLDQQVCIDWNDRTRPDNLTCRWLLRSHYLLVVRLPGLSVGQAVWLRFVWPSRLQGSLCGDGAVTLTHLGSGMPVVNSCYSIAGITRQWSARQRNSTVEPQSKHTPTHANS